MSNLKTDCKLHLTDWKSNQLKLKESTLGMQSTFSCHRVMQLQQVRQNGRSFNAQKSTDLTVQTHANTSLKYRWVFCFPCRLLLASIHSLRASSNACLCTLYSNFVLLDIHYSAQFLCKIAMYLLGETLALKLQFFSQEISLLLYLPIEWPLMKSMGSWEIIRKAFLARVMILLCLFWFLAHSWLNMSRLNKRII